MFKDINSLRSKLLELVRLDALIWTLINDSILCICSVNDNLVMVSFDMKSILAFKESNKVVVK